MTDHPHLRFYLEPDLRQSAEARQHNFINLILKVVESAQFRVDFQNLPIEGEPTKMHSLTHMIAPPNDAGLTFRRVYHYPFWQIEALSKRWHWDVARATFDPAKASSDALRFYRFWQKRLFGEAPQKTSQEGFVYVPLQGRLTRHRLFQICTPLEMIEHTLAHNPTRQVIATLHPKETYTRKELTELKALERKHARLTVASGQMETYLQTCDYVVTQNSSAAFAGYFFGKPALLFGKIDFHHIAQKADLETLDTCYAQAPLLTPAYDKYIWWFWQDQSINAGKDDAEAKIAARLRRFGWPV